MKTTQEHPHFTYLFSVKLRALLISLLFLTTSCIRDPNVDYPVLQTQVMHHTLSCKGQWCCYPWDTEVAACVRLDAEPLTGENSIMVFVRVHK